MRAPQPNGGADSQRAHAARAVRLAYLVSHPIQYQSPLLRRIAREPEIDLTVFFGSDFSVKGYNDKDFGVEVKWDVRSAGGLQARVPARCARHPLRRHLLSGEPRALQPPAGFRRALGAWLRDCKPDARHPRRQIARHPGAGPLRLATQGPSPRWSEAARQAGVLHRAAPAGGRCARLRHT